MLLRPTWVRAKFDGFHISAHGYAKNAPDFTLSNKDIPKSCPILDPNLWRGYLRGVCNTPLHGYMKKTPSFTPKPSARLFEGRMQYAPTRVRAKFDGFHISAHDMTRTLPDFRPKPSARGFSGRMQYALTQVREKPARFHIPAHGCAKNTPDFTLSNKDTPKTCPILGPNSCRRTFRGVCNTPLHGYVQNLAGFRPKPLARNIWGRMLLRPYTDTCKTRPVSYFRTRICQKRTRF